MEMGAYVQQLNTHFGLYSALARSLKEQQAATAAAGGQAAAAAAAAAQGWTPEAVLVGRMLQRDFERSEARVLPLRALQFECLEVG